MEQLKNQNQIPSSAVSRQQTAEWGMLAIGREKEAP